MSRVVQVEVTDQPGDLLDILTAVGTMGAAIAAAVAAWAAVWAIRRTEVPNVVVSTAGTSRGYQVQAANEGPRALTIESVYFLDADDEPHFVSYKEKLGGDTLPQHLVEGQRIQLEYDRDALPEGINTVVVRDSVGRKYETPLNPFVRSAQVRSALRWFKRGPTRGSHR